MFIHLGSDRLIAGNRIIMILNIEDIPADKTKDLLVQAKNEYQITYINKKQKSKALVLCDEGIYISPISSRTLYKRANQVLEEG